MFWFLVTSEQCQRVDVDCGTGLTLLWIRLNRKGRLLVASLSASFVESEGGVVGDNNACQ